MVVVVVVLVVILVVLSGTRVSVSIGSLKGVAGFMQRARIRLAVCLAGWDCTLYWSCKEQGSGWLYVLQVETVNYIDPVKSRRFMSRECLGSFSNCARNLTFLRWCPCPMACLSPRLFLQTCWLVFSLSPCDVHMTPAAWWTLWPRVVPSQSHGRCRAAVRSAPLPPDVVNTTDCG